VTSSPTRTATPETTPASGAMISPHRDLLANAHRNAGNDARVRRDDFYGGQQFAGRDLPFDCFAFDSGTVAKNRRESAIVCQLLFSR
jgi:hypothetical protein